MKDFLITIIIIWALWRIFGNTKVFYHSSNKMQNPNYPPHVPNEGEIKINRPGKKQKDIEAEDTDYEEIK